MKKRYTLFSGIFLFFIFYFLPAFAQAQACSGLQAACTTSESRCMATGTITVQASGGSGNYNYKAVGPITTSFTSSNVITGLQPGVYKVIVRDLTKNCQLEKDSIVVRGTYSDPRFLLSKTDVTCAGNDGTVTINNQQFGRSPFTYTIVAPSPSGIGTTRTSGTFSNLVAGEYAIQLKDSCGGIQVRRVTVESYSWWFNGVAVTKTDCNNADAVILLKDNKGNVNSSSAAFVGFTYGVANAPGDTTWFPSNSFSFFTGTKRSITFVAKDPCGNAHTYTWNVPANAKPSVSNVNISNTSCTQFTATVAGGQNLTSPAYYLFDSTSAVIDSNATGIFSNLPYGDYCIHIKDACYDTTIVKCITALQPTPSVNTNVAISNKTCNTFTATVAGQANLFTALYCLYDADAALVSCNGTGVFINLVYGSYCIKVTDGCTGTVIDRCFSAVKPTPTLTTATVSGQTCTAFDVTAHGTNLNNPQFCLYDSLGNVVTCNSTGVFTGVINGSYCIRAISCSDTTAPVCFSGAALKPAIGATVQISNKACSTFTATVSGQVNLTAPQYCLFDSADVQINCNTTGVFDSVGYGRYCIKVTDGCYDTTIVRCFTQTKPVPAINATMQQLSSTCSTFTAKVTGQQHLYNPQYCIYDASNTLLQCNNTGIFTGLPYGAYCVKVTDGCSGATLQVCQTFSYNYNVTLATSKACAIGSANVDISFLKGNSPFAISVFNPADSLVYSGTTTISARVVLPGLDSAQVYTIIGTDNCGRKDTATIIPDVSTVTKSITAVSKCPSAAWLDGSGDLNITASSNLGTMTPKIIKKDGATFSKTHSSNSGNNYVFSDLEPAAYIVEYSIQNCGTKLYDTFAVQPYAYPTQGRSAIYQCDNKSINLTADVSGGVGPYNYQIIGSEPAIPSIVSAQQSSAAFNINTGTTYSLIRLRTVDACGNATLNDVSVLPLQNILITADTTCLFSDITLSVDTVSGATYTWYKRRSATDSVFLTNDKTYNIPFMTQQDIGTYVCKVELNNSCLTRLASFDLTGYCGEVFLSMPFELAGKGQAFGNLLTWNLTEPHQILYYEVERKLYERGSFTAIGRTYAAGSGARMRYQFMDTGLHAGPVLYRVKAVMQNGHFDYTNSVLLQHDGYSTEVYPNPVHNRLTVLINGTAISNYRIELHNMSGQAVYKWNLQNVSSVQQQFDRPRAVQKGIYLLKISNLTTGTVTYHKLLFD